MTNAAVLSILVKAQGIAETSRQVRAVHGDLGKASRAAGTATSDIEKMGSRGSRALGHLKTAAKLGAVAVGGGLVLGAKKAVTAASDLSEQINKTNVVFRGSEKSVVSWSKGTASSLGISQRAALEATGTFGNMLVPMGFARKEAAGMSTKMVGLAADMASFNNASPKETLDALRSGLAGETEPLRKYGVFLNDARLKQEAMNLGLKNAVGPSGALTTSAKAQATYSLILKDSTDAQGDFARTSGSLANQQRIASALVENLAAKIGKLLLPAATVMLRLFTALVGQMQNGTGVGGALVSVFAAVGHTISSVAGAVAGAVRWFKEHETVALALAAAAGTVATAMVALRVAAIVQMIPGLVASASAWLALNAAMLLNPAVLIVAGLAALAAVIVVAYRESETFRTIVDAAFTAVKAAAEVMWGVLKVVFDGIVAVIRVAWGVVDTVTRAVWGAIGGFLEAFWAVLLTVVTAYFNAYKTVITTVWNVIRTVTEAVWGAIKTVLTAVWTVIQTLITTYFDAYKAIVTAAWNAIKTVTETVWGAIKTIATGAWSVLESAATTAWGLIKTAILSPIRDARDALGGIWDAIKERAGDAWDALKTSAGTFATGLKDAIVDAFKSAVDSVVGFVNKIIDVVNAIPGVPNIGHVKGFARGGANAADAFARGGAYARTGGLVRKPMALMGEEAPRHPEYVIPTNPAYRGRAVGLLSQAAGKLGVGGFAQGGSFVSSAYGPPWTGINGTGVTATGVDLRPAKQVLGVAVDPSVLALGSMLKINPNPFGATNPFKAFDTGSAIKGRRIDFYDWRGRAEQLAWGMRNVDVSTVGPGGILQTVEGIIGAPIDLIKDLIGKLPNPADMLPGWLQGTGKFAIDAAVKFIKKQVSGVLGGSVPGWGQLDRLASALGLGITSTYRPGDDGYHGMLMGLGGRAHATDYSNSTGPTAQMLAFAREVGTKFGSQLKELIYKPLGWGVKNGQRVGLDFPFPWDDHLNHVHVAFQKGGILDAPFVGSYATGGVVPRDGFGYLHGGETVTPAGRGDGPLVHIEHMEIRREQDVEVVARKLAWRITAGVPA